MNDLITMEGPALDGSGEMVTRDVPKGDAWAYERAGYVRLDSMKSTMLINDRYPKLGGNLDLNGHTIKGNLEKQTLVIDGGLIE